MKEAPVRLHRSFPIDGHIHYNKNSKCTQVRTRIRVIKITMPFEDGDSMTVKDAVAKRFRKLCADRGIKLNELANRSGVTPSTVYSMMDESRRELSITTIKKLCDGLDVTLGEFFSTEEFDALEQEVK